MKTLLTTASFLGLLIAPLPLMALEDPASRTITVSGEAEVKVVPDEVVLTLAVETHHKDLTEVKRLNDQRMKDVLAAAVAAGVACVFMEVHQDPDKAPSDGPNMLKLKDLPGLLGELVEIDAIAKRRKN